MTVMHYGGSWFYIDEPAPEDRDNSYGLTAKEWEAIQSLDIPSAKTAVLVRNKTNGTIKLDG